MRKLSPREGWLAAVLAVVMLASACAKGEPPQAPHGVMRESGGAATGMDSPAEPAPAPPADASKEEDDGYSLQASFGDNAKTQPGGPSQKPAPQPGVGIDDPSRKQPILIYKAEFSLSVYEVEKSLNAVEGLAKDAGGYLSRRDDRSITVRIPAQKFQEMVDAIAKVGDVLHRDVVSEDVTAEYRDLEIQLQNQLAMRARFEKLLEKAAKVEEALQIEKELGRITGDIERIKGRLKLLADQARYSTITVKFEPRSSAQVQKGPFVLPLPFLNQVGLRRLMSL